MIVMHLITHGLFYAVVAAGVLFLLMITTSPRIWGYSDYPQAIKDKVPPQTGKEKLIAAIWGVPWILFVLAFPIISTYMLKSDLGDTILFWVAFGNIFSMVLLLTLADLVILDWFVVSRITPKFVMIPGTVKEDYKDLSHHYRAHAKAAVVQILVCLIFAGIVWRF